MDNFDNIILNPLAEYNSKYSHLIKKNATEFFDDLVKKSQVDVKNNRATVKKLYLEQDRLNDFDKKLRSLKCGKGWLIALAVLSALSIIISIISLVVGKNFTAILFGDNLLMDTKTITILHSTVLAVSIALVIFSIVYIVKSLSPKIKEYTELLDKQDDIVDNLTLEARKQMQPLNKLFDYNTTQSIVNKTLPAIKLESNFSGKTSKLFEEIYKTSISFDNAKSTTELLSGESFKNPFVYVRNKEQGFTDRLYTGTRLVTWTETEIDSDGKSRTVTKSEMLTASITRPVPEYSCTTAMYYGNNILPDLSFSRKPTVSGLSENQIERKVNRNERKLAKKAEKALKNGDDFTALANTEFETVFNALDRNDEIDFRQMFTPSAQQNMVDLLTDQQYYGDDVYFNKKGKCTMIATNHMQSAIIDLSPKKFYSIDIDKCKNNFIEFHCNFFKSMYFDMAPLYASKVYQEYMSDYSFEYDEKQGISSMLDAECLANMLGTRAFAPYNASTDSILKAKHYMTSQGEDIFEIDAHSFEGISQIEYVPRRCRNGNTYMVPVPWIYYNPIKNTNYLAVVDLKTYDGIDDNPVIEKYLSNNNGVRIGNYFAYIKK